MSTDLLRCVENYLWYVNQYPTDRSTMLSNMEAIEEEIDSMTNTELLVTLGNALDHAGLYLRSYDDE